MQFVRMLALSVCLAIPAPGQAQSAASGPLRVHPTNPRYFTDGAGKAVYLTGSHTWTSVQDGAPPGMDPVFDYTGFLNFLIARNHNFVRLWAWESARWGRVTFSLLPYQRTGPGNALDGKPKFDLRQLNQAYFDRLRQRAVAARDRGLYVGVMLFQGFSVARKSASSTTTPWMHHPFHRSNNVNEIDGDTNADGEGYELHTLGLPAVTVLQEAYVRKVVDTLNDLDNVIFEISNESHGASKHWQYHMIRLIQSHEAAKPKRHLVWMSFTWDGIQGSGTNKDLFDSPAQVVSPRSEGWTYEYKTQDYKNNPPAATGAKVVISDTDHLYGVGGDRTWVWKSFLRALHPIFMDPYHKTPHNPASELQSKWGSARDAMGDTLAYAKRMNLAALTPRNSLSSTTYCLAAPGTEYLVYQPGRGAFAVTLNAGTYDVEWFNPVSRVVTAGSSITTTAGTRSFTPPFGGQAVLYLKASSAPSPTSSPSSQSRDPRTEGRSRPRRW